MSVEVTGINKPAEIDRKENLREHQLYWIGRRTQDVILSSLALVALSPVMLATAIAIVVDDPSAGPIFSQERIARLDAIGMRWEKNNPERPSEQAAQAETVTAKAG